MPLTMDELFTSPDHYLHSFDQDAAVFVPMDRPAYRRSIFLDGRISPAANEQMRIPVATLASYRSQPKSVGYIFHVAHCGSTLLARALDREAGNLVLREPLALRQSSIDPDPTRFDLTLTMVGKRYRADQRTLVKANVPVNFILPSIITGDLDARVVFLHLGLRDYLLAILRSEAHRTWLRNVTTQLAPYVGDLSALSDAERAAALWFAQVHAFAEALGSLPSARTLDAEVFFAEPADCLTRAADLLEVPMSADDARNAVASSLFSSYSKKPNLPFHNADRLARKRELEVSLAPELESASRWIAAHRDEAVAATATLASRAL